MVFNYFYLRVEFRESGFSALLKKCLFGILGQHKGAYNLTDKQHSVLKLISVISINRAGQGLIRETQANKDKGMSKRHLEYSINCIWETQLQHLHTPCM